MNLAIVGSRTVINYKVLLEAMDELKDEFPELNSTLKIDTIISGGASGVDKLAEDYARRHGLVFIKIPADWKAHGRAAGPLRNQVIVDLADMVLAVWDGESRGTKDTITKTKEAGKPLHIYLL